MKEERVITKNKKIVVKPIDKERPFFKEGHDGRIRYSGCYNSFTLPWKTSSRSYVKIFEEGEQALFEKALGLEEDALNLYKRKGSWWGKFFIDLDKNEKTLDLNNPMEVLEYRVLKANTDSFATSKGEYNGTQDYFLIDQDEVEETNNKSAERFGLAMELYMKIRKSDKKMYDILRVLELKPSKQIMGNTKALESEIYKIIQQVQKIAGLPNIDDFIEAAQDALFSDKLFTLDAIEIGAIELQNGVFKITESGIPLGRSIQEVAEYFNLAKNQEDKLLIQRRIELNK